MTLDSFLPRIQSVFYAVFDSQAGPKILYQVPEGLIATSDSAAIPPSSPVDPAPSLNRERSARSTTVPSKYLFHFDDISKYVIPPHVLCDKLVTCSTKNHRILGFPKVLKGMYYARNFFEYNLCFVFERSADLSCYEPIVRKISRVLTGCEKESAFLSNPETSTTLQSILEQLYEDLNSYSETSIPIDRFNSIELKIFPFYPNPPQVTDWMVPLALINIKRRVEDNWDLTLVKVCDYIDGTNHVSRIAHLADCDIVLTRQAISHLLFYQVIMTIDIFQYSNMYTLSRNIQWLADETHVRDECGPYVTKSGHRIPDWPQLLRLYSRFKPGKTVLEWMEAHNVAQMGIDARRFTSFGVIKGFLRRVHRWPVLLPPDPSQSIHLSDAQLSTPSFARKRNDSLSTTTPVRFPLYPPSPPFPDMNHISGPQTMLTRQRSPTTSSAQPPSPELNAAVMAHPTLHDLPQNAHPAAFAMLAASVSVNRARRTSAAERVLEQLRNRDTQHSGGCSVSGLASPRTSWIYPPAKDDATAALQELISRRPGSRRSSLITPMAPPSSPTPVKPINLPPTNALLHSRAGWTTVSRAGLQAPNQGLRPYPVELLDLLDGEHHTDELSVRFEAGWPVLEKWLVAAGGGQGNGDFGKIRIVYR